MIRFLMKILITALAFVYLLPMIPGIDFHGNFMAAIGLAVMFGVMLWAIEMIAMALSAVWTVGTLGLALLWIIPLWIIGFWILPAAALMLVAVIMPTHLTVSGWMPAILAGLVMLVIGVLTSKTLWGKRSPAQPA